MSSTTKLDISLDMVQIRINLNYLTRPEYNNFSLDTLALSYNYNMLWWVKVGQLEFRVMYIKTLDFHNKICTSWARFFTGIQQDLSEGFKI